MSVNDIYTQLINEHSRDKRNRREIEGANRTHSGVNATCGDEITLQVREEGGVIADLGFTGHGCAVSMASASMMTDVLRGKTAEDAARLCGLFLDMIKDDVSDESALDELEEAISLRGIAKMPARVRCAVLPWHTFQLTMGAEG